jgi:DNA-directed RNA polymerase subunit RPC12/RpoP
VTYWKLRSYLKEGDPLKIFEFGNEPSPAAYVQNLVMLMGMLREVMTPQAVAWLNVGDSYATSGGSGRQGSTGQRADRSHTLVREGGTRQPEGVQEGSLCLIPQRLAVALADDGWLVRSVVAWEKPSCMPASLAGWRWMRCRRKVRGVGIVEGRKMNDLAQQSRTTAGLGRRTGGKDMAPALWEDCPGCRKCQVNEGFVLRKGSWRPTSSWEPLLMLARPGYFADGEPVKTAPADSTLQRDRHTRILDDPDEQYAARHDHETRSAGANLRDVWEICSEAMKAGICMECGRFFANAGKTTKKTGRKCPTCGSKVSKHYASFPEALARTAMASSVSAHGYCRACSAPWVRLIETRRRPEGDAVGERGDVGPHNHGQGGNPFMEAESNTIGWRATCKCDAGEPRRGVVLDPFCGTARTGLAARALWFDFVGVELAHDHAELSRKILYEDAPLFSNLPDDQEAT